MTAFLLKLIAVITMTLDHVGAYLLPADSVVCMILRSIGRIAFPLFAFFISQGFKYTKNKILYLYRLFVLAVVTEIIYVIFPQTIDYTSIFGHNIFITLLAGLLCLTFLRNKRWFVKLFCLPVVALVCWIKPDYSLYGVLMIILFEFADGILLKTVGLVLLNALFIHILPLIPLPCINSLSMYSIQWCTLFVLLPIAVYNGKYGIEKHKTFWKYFFYAYYPFHLVVIFLIATFI